MKIFLFIIFLIFLLNQKSLATQIYIKKNMSQGHSNTIGQINILNSAKYLFRNLSISYTYGGKGPLELTNSGTCSINKPKCSLSNRINIINLCQECNLCLYKHRPKASFRIQKCPVCLKCSIDCSHFVHLVFKMAGFYLPYLSTKEMLNYSAKRLFNNYKLLVIKNSPAIVGDLLVYLGHVVILTKVRSKGVGDIINATSGKDIKSPGQSIQREYFVHYNNFHGHELRRVLRHVDLLNNNMRAKKNFLRPIVKKKLKKSTLIDNSTYN